MRPRPVWGLTAKNCCGASDVTGDFTSRDITEITQYLIDKKLKFVHTWAGVNNGVENSMQLGSARFENRSFTCAVIY